MRTDRRLRINTADVLDVIAASYLRPSWEPADPEMVQMSTSTTRSYISRLDVVQDYQIRGKGGEEVNHFVKLAKRPKIKEPRPIANCPLGTLVTTEGPMTSGLLPLTDSPGIMAAFAERAMNNPDDDLDPKACRKVAKVANLVIEELLVSVPDPGPEPDAVEFFRKHYQGKRPVKYIDRVVNDYNNVHLMGKNCKFKRKSGFNKLEPSESYKEDAWQLRMRMITCQSDQMLIECCPTHGLLKVWKLGEVSRYQTKGLSAESTQRMIAEVTHSCHMVTDHKSFEQAFRQWLLDCVDRKLIDRLCDKFGWLTTKRMNHKHFSGKSLIYTVAGTLALFSRPSGFPTTSDGNGLGNIVIVVYLFVCHYPNLTVKTILRLIRMIAEGDDGVLNVTWGVPNLDPLRSVGFKLSLEVLGSRPADADFLRSLWDGTHRCLNVARSLKVLWIKGSGVPGMRRSKRLALLRCSANSLHHLSPHHPILGALIDWIGTQTRHCRPFKRMERYLDDWKGERELGMTGFPREYKVNESLRPILARGCSEFPGIPISIQVMLEGRFRQGNLFVGSLFSDTEEIKGRMPPLESSLPDWSPWLVKLTDLVLESMQTGTPTMSDGP
jgi:hypothetical protein